MTPATEYAALASTFRTPFDAKHGDSREDILRVEVLKLRKKLKFYRHLIATRRGGDGPEKEKEEAVRNATSRCCPLCASAKRFVQTPKKTRASDWSSGPAVDAIVNCLPSPHGFMAAIMIRSIFFNYLVGNSTLMSQIQFVVFANDCELAGNSDEDAARSQDADLNSQTARWLEIPTLWDIVFETYCSSTNGSVSTTTRKADGSQSPPLEWCLNFEDFCKAIGGIASRMHPDASSSDALVRLLLNRLLPMAFTILLSPSSRRPTILSSASASNFQHTHVRSIEKDIENAAAAMSTSSSTSTSRGICATRTPRYAREGVHGERSSVATRDFTPLSPSDESKLDVDELLGALRPIFLSYVNLKSNRTFDIFEARIEEDGFLRFAREYSLVPQKLSRGSLLRLIRDSANHGNRSRSNDRSQHGLSFRTFLVILESIAWTSYGEGCGGSVEEAVRMLLFYMDMHSSGRLFCGIIRPHSSETAASSFQATTRRARGGHVLATVVASMRSKDERSHHRRRRNDADTNNDAVRSSSTETHTRRKSHSHDDDDNDDGEEYAAGETSPNSFVQMGLYASISSESSLRLRQIFEFYATFGERNRVTRALPRMTSSRFMKLMRDARIPRLVKLRTDNASVDLIFECALRWQRKRIFAIAETKNRADRARANRISRARRLNFGCFCVALTEIARRLYLNTVFVDTRSCAESHATLFVDTRDGTPDEAVRNGGALDRLVSEFLQRSSRSNSRRRWSEGTRRSHPRDRRIWGLIEQVDDGKPVPATGTATSAISEDAEMSDTNLSSLLRAPAHASVDAKSAPLPALPPAHDSPPVPSSKKLNDTGRRNGAGARNGTGTGCDDDEEVEMRAATNDAEVSVPFDDCAFDKSSARPPGLLRKVSAGSIPFIRKSIRSVASVSIDTDIETDSTINASVLSERESSRAVARTLERTKIEKNKLEDDRLKLLSILQSTIREQRLSSIRRCIRDTVFRMKLRGWSALCALLRVAARERFRAAKTEITALEDGMKNLQKRLRKAKSDTWKWKAKSFERKIAGGVLASKEGDEEEDEGGY
eukprot:g171.t1